MMLDATPTKDNLPTSFYDAKMLVSKLGLEVRKIDCCISGCMLFYDNEFGTKDGALEECKFCQSPRYKVRSKAIDCKQKRVVVKSMFYLSIIPRLKRMFASMHNASQMTWHHTNKTSSGTMRHPSDSEAWKHFDRIWDIHLGLQLWLAHLGLQVFLAHLGLQVLAHLGLHVFLAHLGLQVLLLIHSSRDSCLRDPAHPTQVPSSVMQSGVSRTAHPTQVPDREDDHKEPNEDDHEVDDEVDDDNEEEADNHDEVTIIDERYYIWPSGNS
jgi:hypothetical protein